MPSRTSHALALVAALGLAFNPMLASPSFAQAAPAGEATTAPQTPPVVWPLANRIEVVPRVGGLVYTHPLVVAGGEAPGLSLGLHWATPSLDVGVLGFGWRHDFETRIEVLDEALLRLVEADGTGVTLRREGEEGLWVSTTGVRWEARALEGGGTVVTEPDGGSRSFDAAGLLVSVGDRQGALLTLARDGEGRLLEVRDAVGRTLGFEWSGRALRAVVDPAGRRCSFDYDAIGNLAAINDTSGRQTRFRSDTSYLLSEIVPPAGDPLRLAYDGTARILSMEGADVARRTYRYSAETEGGPRARRVEVTDGDGGVTVHRFLDSDRRVLVSDPVGGVSEVRLDGRGNVVYQKEADGVAWQIERDAASRPVRIHASDGRAWGVTYTAHGRVARYEEPGGGVWRYAYDDGGRLLSETDPAGGVLALVWGEGRWPTGVVDPRGQTVSVEHDASGRVLGIRDANGQTVRYEYDALGRQTRATGPSGDWVAFRYDTDGNLTEARNSLGETLSLEHDAAGVLAEAIDPVGGTTRFERDALGRVAGIIDPLGGATRFTRTVEGWLRQVTDPRGQVVQRYERDRAGRARSRTDAAGRTTRYQRDAVGRVVAVTNARGERIAYEYDAAGRIVQVKAGEAILGAFTYDAAGRVVEARNGEAAWKTTYDAMGRPLEVEDLAAGKAIAYRYDASGLRTAMVLPDDEVSYAYDAAGRPTRVVSKRVGTVAYAYATNGQVATIGYPNGVVARHEYDGVGRVTAVTHTRGEETLRTVRYEYDPRGFRVAMEVAGEGRTDYEYDAAARLVGVVGPDEAVGYAYDPAGNRTAVAVGETRTEAEYGPDSEILERGRIEYRHDADGNLVEAKGPDGVTRYAYDALNQLVEVRTAAGRVVRYGYGPDGRRVWREEDGKRVRYLLDGPHRVADLDGEAVTATWLYGPGFDRPVAQVAGGVARYLHRDGDLSVSTLTDTSGAVAATVAYDPFGTPRGLESAGTPFGYAGRPWDAVTGLYDLRARTYDPVLGRYTSRDPSGLDGGVNPYVYVLDHPVDFVDPDGEFLHILAGAAVGAVIGATASAIVEVSAQMIEGRSLKELDWKRVGARAAGGAVGGAVSGAINTALPGAGILFHVAVGAAAGGAAGLAGNATTAIVSNALNGRRWSEGVGKAAAEGLVFGAIGGAAAGLFQGAMGHFRVGHKVNQLLGRATGKPLHLFHEGARQPLVGGLDHREMAHRASLGFGQMAYRYATGVDPPARGALLRGGHALLGAVGQSVARSAPAVALRAWYASQRVKREAAIEAERAEEEEQRNAARRLAEQMSTLGGEILGSAGVGATAAGLVHGGSGQAEGSRAPEMLREAGAQLSDVKTLLADARRQADVVFPPGHAGRSEVFADLGEVLDLTQEAEREMYEQAAMAEEAAGDDRMGRGDRTQGETPEGARTDPGVPTPDGARPQ